MSIKAYNLENVALDSDPSLYGLTCIGGEQTMLKYTVILVGLGYFIVPEFRLCPPARLDKGYGSLRVEFVNK